MSDSSVLIQTITTNSSKLDLIWLHYHSKHPMIINASGIFLHSFFFSHLLEINASKAKIQNYPSIYLFDCVLFIFINLYLFWILFISPYFI
jgi:hypothetical protein